MRARPALLRVRLSPSPRAAVFLYDFHLNDRQHTVHYLYINIYVNFYRYLLEHLPYICRPSAVHLHPLRQALCRTAAAADELLRANQLTPMVLNTIQPF